MNDVNDKTLREYLRALDHMKGFFQGLLDQEIKLAKKPKSKEDYLLEFTELKDMIRSGGWPLAVPEGSIVDNEESKIARARYIIDDVIMEPMKGLRFLDYGCGEGHVVDAAGAVEVAVGYDTKEDNWDEKSGLLTTNKENIKLHGPYDIVLLYDVLDHEDSPVELLRELKKHMKPKARMYVRCHPWSSRHATHIYKEANFAYIHLVCTEEELIKLGYSSKKTQKLVQPLKSYKNWFTKAGFSILEETPIIEPPEPFFSLKGMITRRIAENFWTEKQGLPKQQMELQFVDYVLTQ
jgi:2-polyprenyl-3-methyl-5-hydroxy-6-metoxy-1,4-benzoquinol methylase